MRVPKKPKHRSRLPFYWWRRFPVHKSLKPSAKLIDKIENGDFDYPQFFKEAEYELHWMKEEQADFIENYQGKDPEHDNLYLEIEIRARKRYNKLFEDGIKDDAGRIDSLVSNFSKHFKVKKDKVTELMNEFDGTVLEFYRFMREDLVS